MQDKFLNTPLLLASIYNYEVRKEDKLEIIKSLLDNGSDPNVYNLYSGFTPLHWAARYGEVKIIRMLLNSGAHEYTPDHKGFFPIDYAGKFNHQEAMKILINVSLENIKKYEVTNKLKDKFAVNKALKSSTLAKKSPYDMEEFLGNQVYHTSLLYWACYLPEKYMDHK